MGGLFARARSRANVACARRGRAPSGALRRPILCGSAGSSPPRRSSLLEDLAPACSAAAVPAQSLVANLNTGNFNNGSSGTGPFYVVGGQAVFATSPGGQFGSEVYVTDGTPAGTNILRDLMPDGTANIGGLTVVGSQVFFVADVPGLGREIWKTDGTAAGAVLVADIFPGGINSGLSELQTAGGVLYMTASGSSVAGEQVWASDGTASGTYQVTNSINGPLNPYRDLTATDAGVFFLHDDGGGSGFELWFSDGTPGTELMLKDIRPGAATGPR